ncbi:MAG: hypothetical protein LBH19_06305 [Dysgonamonadaceae bacterium]|nr:hypothetical protein [Dysgonamonadaceae bacterium]
MNLVLFRFARNGSVGSRPVDTQRQYERQLAFFDRDSSVVERSFLVVATRQGEESPSDCATQK